MDQATPSAPTPPLTEFGAEWFDPLEDAVRGEVRAFIERLLEEELEAALGRGRYARDRAARGHRNGHRERRLDTTFGPLVLTVPRARLAADEAGEREWKSALLPAYRRLSRRAELLIAEVYLAGVNTRRVRRALQALFAGRIGKDAVSRAWRRTRAAWETWQQRDLADDDIVRLILDGTVVKVRLDRKATAISLLIALGVRRDGQKVVLAIKNMGGESEAAWRAVLDDLLTRGLAKPELVIVDGGKGLEAALASLWDDVPVQRCFRAQGAQPAGACAAAPARRDQGRLQRPDVRPDRRRGAGQAQGVPGQMEAPLPAGRDQPRGGGRAPVHLRALSARAVALGEDHERRRAPARGVQAADQDPVPAALRRDRRHAVLGVAGVRSDHHAPG
jgi:hypothetical protein